MCHDGASFARRRSFAISIPRGGPDVNGASKPQHTKNAPHRQPVHAPERQRLGLARAFLHGAPFLLLDEPTSNLDSLNEAVILRSLGQESAGRTVVLVSHRRSTLRIADRVVSVERGRLS